MPILSLHLTRILKIVTFSLLIILIFSVFFHYDNAITQDLGRHLTLGKIIWEKKIIPNTNYFSYTNPDFPVVNHHWGGQVIFHLLNQMGGNRLLIIVKAVLLSVSCILLVKFSLERADYLITLAAGIVSIEVFRERTQIRPEIFAYILFTLLLIILYREKERKDNWLFVIPILGFLWINLHISFIILPAVYLLFIIDRLLNKRFDKRYLLSGILIIAAFFINPFGLKGLMYPLNIFNNYGYPIVENQTPFFLEKVMNNPTILYFKIAGLLLFLVTPILIFKKHYFEISCGVLTLVLSATAIRHFPFFALSVVYPLALGMTTIKNKIIKTSRIGVNNLYKAGKIFNIILLVMLISEITPLLTNSYYRTRFSPVQTGIGQVEGMREAVNYFQKNNFTGPIFNNFDIGSYLIYRLYPDNQVFVDGRPEAYPASFFREVYIPMQEKEEIWEKMVKKYDFQTIIFGHTDGTPWGRNFLEKISKNRYWQIVYFDDYGVILIKRKTNFQEAGSDDVINPDLKSMGLKKLQEMSSPDELVRLANLFGLIGLSDLETLAKIKSKT